MGCIIHILFLLSAEFRRAAYYRAFAVYIIYINDLADVFGPGLTVKLFADDVKICINIDDINSFELLQDGLNALSRWASEWQLNVSINNCTTLHLGRNNAMRDYAIDGVTLPNVRIIRDLGVIVDSKLSFSAHFAHITAKAHQRAGLIGRCFNSPRTHTFFFRAFKVYVRPIVEYCSPVWSPLEALCVGRFYYFISAIASSS